MHLRSPLPFLVHDGAGSSIQGGIDDCALLHGHAALLEMGFHRLKNLLTKFGFHKQVMEDQDRGLIWNSVAGQVDPTETLHGEYLDQRFFYAGNAEAAPLLHQMNS